MKKTHNYIFLIEFLFNITEILFPKRTTTGSTYIHIYILAMNSMA